MAPYLTFEQRLLRKRQRKIFLKYILTFLMLNFFFTKFVLQIFMIKGNEMFPTITKNASLFFVATHITSFFIPLKMNDIVLYEDFRLSNNFLLTLIKDFFFLNKIFKRASYKVSRIAAVQGDSVYVRGLNVLVNKKDTDFFYLNGNLVSYYKLNNFFNTDEVVKCFILKKNEVFLLNDNLSVLNDSRIFGPINKNAIVSFLAFRVVDYKIVK
ncbi:signal peptidase I [Borreliella bavariensis]|uniref:signal peptidase I n=1 Tax=Borreliella bavariensis TaxID=664662 RepID=UPI001C022825|nr:signal peptidase I [Borreliella bavariensis]